MITSVSGTKAVKNHPGVYAYQVKRGPANKRTRYAAVATVLGVQRWTRGHMTIRDAEAARDELRNELRGGATEASARLTVAEYLEKRWLPSLEVTPGSLRVYRIGVARIIAAIGTVRLGRVTVQLVEAFKAWMRDQGLAPSTRNKSYTILAMALKEARRLRLIATNPCELTKPPPRGKRTPPEVDVDAMRRLLTAARDEGYEMLVWLAMDSGLREQKEIFSAEWGNLDVARAVLRVPSSKSPAGVRAVLLGPETIARLQAHRIEQMKRYRDLGAAPTPLMFTDRGGRRLTQGNFYETWNRIRTAAGVPDLHFHDLRHVHTTVLARMGVHWKVAQARLGHADAKMTTDVYTHEVPEGQAEAALALETLLGRE